MPQDVIISFPKRHLKNADIEFQALKDGKTVGTLKVSKGAVEWFPRNSKTNRYKLNWEQFNDAMMQTSKKRR